MSELKKLSDLTYLDVIDYLRLTEVTQNEIDTVKTLLNISKSYICEYTGRTEEELDKKPDVIIVALILCQDMFDNRAFYVDSSNLNKVVESILDLHSVNLL